jgi:hypothetical protein
VKAVDHQSNIRAVYFFDDFIREREGLDAAIGLTKKFECQGDAMVSGYGSEFIENSRGLADYFRAD